MTKSEPAAYAVVLADLRAQRDRLDTAIDAIIAVMPVEEVSAGKKAIFPNPLPGPKVQEGEFVGMIIIDASIELLRRAGIPQHVSTLVEALNRGGIGLTGDQANTVGSILNRRAREKGDVRRVGRGTWTLSSPTLPLPPEDIGEVDEDLIANSGDLDSASVDLD